MSAAAKKKERRISFDEPLPEVVAMDDLRSIAKLCPDCGALAVVPLTHEQLAKQPDNTTHVCHPALAGCNLGYGRAR